MNVACDGAAQNVTRCLVDIAVGHRSVRCLRRDASRVKYDAATRRDDLDRAMFLARAHRVTWCSLDSARSRIPIAIAISL